MREEGARRRGGVGRGAESGAVASPGRAVQRRLGRRGSTARGYCQLLLPPHAAPPSPARARAARRPATRTRRGGARGRARGRAAAPARARARGQGRRGRGGPHIRCKLLPPAHWAARCNLRARRARRRRAGRGVSSPRLTARTWERRRSVAARLHPKWSGAGQLLRYQRCHARRRGAQHRGPRKWCKPMRLRHWRRHTSMSRSS